MFYKEPSPPPGLPENLRARAQAAPRAMVRGGEASVPDLGGYLRYVANQVICTYATPPTATLHYVGEVGCRVRWERAALLGLIVAELVSNSLKHAHPAGVPGTVAIRCYRLASNIVVEVSDNGAGLPQGIDPAEDGPGFGLIRSLARQVGGTVSFTSTARGFACRIRLPVLSLVRSGGPR